MSTPRQVPLTRAPGLAPGSCGQKRILGVPEATPRTEPPNPIPSSGPSPRPRATGSTCTALTLGSNTARCPIVTSSIAASTKLPCACSGGLDSSERFGNLRRDQQRQSVRQDYLLSCQNSGPVTRKPSLNNHTQITPRRAWSIRNRGSHGEFVRKVGQGRDQDQGLLTTHPVFLWAYANKYGFTLLGRPPEDEIHRTYPCRDTFRRSGRG